MKTTQEGPVGDNDQFAFAQNKSRRYKPQEKQIFINRASGLF